jgi:hypothetical protein
MKTTITVNPVENGEIKPAIRIDMQNIKSHYAVEQGSQVTFHDGTEITLTIDADHLGFMVGEVVTGRKREHNGN